jgi:hypothetical protein
MHEAEAGKPRLRLGTAATGRPGLRRFLRPRAAAALRRASGDTARPGGDGGQRDQRAHRGQQATSASTRRSRRLVLPPAPLVLPGGHRGSGVSREINQLARRLSKPRPERKLWNSSHSSAPSATPTPAVSPRTPEASRGGCRGRRAARSSASAGRRRCAWRRPRSSRCAGPPAGAGCRRP